MITKKLVAISAQGVDVTMVGIAPSVGQILTNFKYEDTAMGSSYIVYDEDEDEGKTTKYYLIYNDSNRAYHELGDELSGWGVVYLDTYDGDEFDGSRIIGFWR